MFLITKRPDYQNNTYITFWKILTFWSAEIVNGIIFNNLDVKALTKAHNKLEKSHLSPNTKIL